MALGEVPADVSRALQLVRAHRNHVFILVLFCTNAFTLFALFRRTEDSHASRTARQHAAAAASKERQQQQLLPLTPRHHQHQHVHAQQQQTLAALRLTNITQRTFARGLGLQGFVFFSAYRVNASKFVAMGLSPLMLHKTGLQARDCTWWAGGAHGQDPVPIRGRISVEYPGESHQKQYEVVMLVCHLSSPTPPAKAVNGGGHLVMLIEREELVVYGEAQGHNVPLEPSAPFASMLTYCSQPIYGNFHEQRVVEWVEFHRVGHGVDRFHLYDVGGVAESLLVALRPYVGSDVMTLTDISEVGQFETWYAQVLAMNDCAYRSVFQSQWVLFLDLDEYIFVNPTLGRLNTVLKRHEGKAWVSFGSAFFYTKMCSHSFNLSANATAAQRWEVERMIFRQSEVHCVAPHKHESRFLCLGYDGHRKYVADPRQVEISGIHSVTKPKSGGVDLDARLIHLNHYRGLNTRYIHSCRQFIHDTDWIPKSWTRDFSLSRLAVRIRFEAMEQAAKTAAAAAAAAARRGRVGQRRHRWAIGGRREGGGIVVGLQVLREGQGGMGNASSDGTGDSLRTQQKHSRS